MGPSSGTLIFRRRVRLCSLMRILKPVPAFDFSPFSLFWPMARAKACSGSSDLPGHAGSCFPVGKSWYFLSAWCILQTKGCLLSCDGEALPSCRRDLGKLGPTASLVKVVAYRVIGRLWGDGLCYIIIEAKREVIGLGIQQACCNVSHWNGAGPVCV